MLTIWHKYKSVLKFGTKILLFVILLLLLKKLCISIVWWVDFGLKNVLCLMI